MFSVRHLSLQWTASCHITFKRSVATCAPVVAVDSWECTLLTAAADFATFTRVIAMANTGIARDDSVLTAGADSVLTAGAAIHLFNWTTFSVYIRIEITIQNEVDTKCTLLLFPIHLSVDKMYL